MRNNFGGNLYFIIIQLARNISISLLIQSRRKSKSKSVIMTISPIWIWLFSQNPDARHEYRNGGSPFSLCEVAICNQVREDCDDFEECGVVICNQVDGERIVHLASPWGCSVHSDRNNTHAWLSLRTLISCDANYSRLTADNMFRKLW